jgi:glycolate oxidase iron-sulfur subunit
MVVESRSRFSFFYGQHALQRVAARLTLARPRLLEGLVKAGVELNTLSLLPGRSGLRLKLGLLEKRGREPETFSEKQPGPGTQGAAYFTGCLARYLQPSVAGATGRLYRNLTGKTPWMPEAQVCCGLAARSSGSLEEARSLAKKNIDVFAETAGPILTSCASCSSHLSTYPDMFVDDPEWHEKALSFSTRVREFSGFFLERLAGVHPEAESSTRVHYHEPCHLRFDPANRDATHQLLDMIRNTIRTETHESTSCCGQGGLFHLGYPELSEKIFTRLHDVTQAERPDIVVTTCSGCLMQWQAGLALRDSPVDAVHLAVFLADCLGIGTRVKKTLVQTALCC